MGRPAKTSATRAKPARRAKKLPPTRAPAPSKPDPARLLHDLEVHKAELESQNEELLRARHDQEQALAQYTELFDFAPIGYATVDVRDVIRNINHVGARLLGRNRARVVGVRFGVLLARASVGPLNALLARVRETDEPGTCEVRTISSEDGGLVLHVTATPRPREPQGILLAFEDITVRKFEQERLVETEQALREAARRKDEFLAMLSHELRNPLAPIRTSLFVLARSESGSTTSLEARQIVERQVEHLTRIVDDLLDVTRLGRGKIMLQRQHVDLTELARRSIEDHRAGFEANRLALAIVCPSEPLWVDVDPARIVQVVSNLLGNAEKFTPSGGRIDVVLARRSERAELRVRDTGAGIPRELLPHVFEPFTQGPQALDRSRGGLGLGLAMVKGFIELHGGSVGIESGGLGRGTEITIHLPLAEARLVAVAPPVPRLPSRRVLVIEDQADAGRILATALGLLGLQVRVAVNGRDALAAARDFHPEIVLCDIGLPGMDGYAVARAFRGDDTLRDTYLVALSGYAQPEDVERATAAGFSRHVAKPASLDTLARVIAEAA